MLDSDTKQWIAIEIINTLYKRFEKFPEDSSDIRNAPFHKAFLEAFKPKINGKIDDIPFFISLSSWLHGLNTTIGQSFFETTAHHLCSGEKRAFTTKKSTSLEVTRAQKEKVQQIITNLKNGNSSPSLDQENTLLSEGKNSERIEASDFTVDVFFERKDEIYAIELKSVKPNSGELKGEKEKILEAKAALMLNFPENKINYYIGFPFDPTSNDPTGYDKEKFLASIINGKKYFDPNEILLSEELWDFLSEQKRTMDQLLELINEIAKPDFQETYSFLNRSDNRYINPSKYKSCLKNWHLNFELSLIEKIEKFDNTISENLHRLYNQEIFDDGKYKTARYLKINDQ